MSEGGLPEVVLDDPAAQRSLTSALELARGLASRPVAEHAATLEEAHRLLAEALATLDQA